MSYLDEYHHHHESIPSFTNGMHHSHFNKNILLIIAIVSLSMFLVLVLALYFYAMAFLRREPRGRAGIHQPSLNPAHANAQSIEPHNKGLDPLLVKALPMFIFKRKGPNPQQREDHDSDDDDECAVCLGALEDEEMVKLLPNCKHTFHVGCIDTWLGSYSTCPICRTEAEPWLEPLPREGPKINGSNSRMSSFRRILSGERSLKRMEPSSHGDIDQDLERQ